MRIPSYLCMLLLLALSACQPPEKEVVSAPPLPPDDPRWIEQDWLAPTSRPEEALTQRLEEVTLSTNHLDSIRLFYVDGMGMTLEGPLEVPAETKRIQRKLWGIPDGLNWQQYRLDRLETEGEVRIRVLVFKEELPSIHGSYDPLELGPLSIGFPNLNQTKLDARIRQLGFTALAKLETNEVPRPDGQKYSIAETIFNAPDFVHGVGITRGNGMRQMAPVDSVSELGGPGYSALVVHDSEAVLAFYTEVLGMELRSDRQWKSSPGSALGIPEGIPFRFAIVYPQGARTGQLLFLDFADDREKPAANPPRVPNRGIGMWTFLTRDLAEIEQRAQAAGTTVLHGRVDMDSPDLGPISVMTLLAPDGLAIEVYEKRAE